MIDLRFHKVTRGVEATGCASYYTTEGYFRVEVVGFGKTQAKAEKAAKLLLDLARQQAECATKAREEA